MHICFDWDGTLARFEIAHEAAMRRSRTLGQEFDPAWLKEAMKTDKHYENNKELIKKYTGVTDERVQTSMMTDLFRYHYLGVANEKKDEVLFPEIKDMLSSLKQNNTLSIATTLRQDIVDEVLKNLGIRDYFEYVQGNNPELDYTKQQLLDHVIDNSVKDKIEPPSYMVGDKKDDVDAAKARNMKGVLVTWGSHQSYEKADYTANSVKELEKYFH